MLAGSSPSPPDQEPLVLAQNGGKAELVATPIGWAPRAQQYALIVITITIGFTQLLATSDH